VELNIKSPVFAALCQHAFPRLALSAVTRSATCTESWVSYLARGVRQRRCRESPHIAAAFSATLFVDPANRLLACGQSVAAGQHFDPTPVAGMADVRVRSVAAGDSHCLVLRWDGLVYSWGKNTQGKLGHGDELDRESPTLIEGLEGVCGIAAYEHHSFAVMQSGDVLSWGAALEREDDLQASIDSEDTQDYILRDGSHRPILVEGLEGVRVRQVFVHDCKAFAVGEDGELFMWGENAVGWRDPSPKRVEALRGVPVSTVAPGAVHTLALAADGLVYAWGHYRFWGLLGNPHVQEERLPKPVEALRGVRVGSIAVGCERSYAVSVTGELWAWGIDRGETGDSVPLGHGEQADCLVPKPIESMLGVKVEAVVTGDCNTFVLADGVSVYAWGTGRSAQAGALGLGPAVSDVDVRTPQRIPALRSAVGLWL
jgi:alpha-tubulin suppressor-like RCC1 family protein